jgi:hypothetical protein
VGLLDGRRVVRLRRGGVVDEHDRHPGAHGDLTYEPVVGVAVAQDPAATVEVHDGGERAAGAPRPDDADGDLAVWTAGNGPVLEVGSRLGNLDSLRCT